MNESPARKFDPIAISAESTVVAEYVPTPSDSAAYQSEAALEAQRTRRLADWNAAAAPLRAPGVMPEAARAWLDERTRLLDRADAARRDAAELEALQAALARADRHEFLTHGGYQIFRIRHVRIPPKER